MPTPKDEQVRLYLWKLYQQRIGSNTAQSDKIAKSARQAILYLYVYTSILILIYLIWPSSYAILIPDIVLQNSRAAQIQKCIKEAARNVDQQGYPAPTGYMPGPGLPFIKYFCEEATQPNYGTAVYWQTAILEMFIIASGIFSFLLYRKRQSRLKLMIENRQIIRSDSFPHLQHRVSKLHRFIAELTIKLSIMVKVDLWINRMSMSPSPSVLTMNGQGKTKCTILVVTPRFLVLDEAIQRAMLAHECGHILQEDTFLWDYPYYISTAFLVGTSVCALIAIVACIITQNILIPVTVGVAIKKLYNARKETSKCIQLAERLADTCAILQCGTNDLERALKLLRAKGEGLFHPSKKQRFALIEHYRKTTNL